MKQEQNSANGDHNSVGGKTDATRQPTPLVVKTAIAVWIFLIGVFLLWLVIGDYVSDRAESIKLFIASIFSLAIVIVVVIQTVIYFKQSEIMKDQWQAMRDAIAQTREQTGMTVASIIISQSSYVGIADLNLLPSNQILIKIENRGAIPAEGVKLRLDALGGIKTNYVSKNPQARRSFHHPFSSDYGRAKLFRDSMPFTYSVRLDGFLSSHEIALIRENKGIFGLRGHIDYHDGLNEKDVRRTEFSYLWLSGVWHAMAPDFWDGRVHESGSGTEAEDKSENANPNSDTPQNGKTNS